MADTNQIKELVEEMKLYKNPELLEKTKKEIKKNVPFSMRGYLLAYLYVTSKRGFAKPVDRKSENQKSTNTHPEIEGSVSLYMNVGKLSKGSARDLAAFICEEAKISDADILSIAYKQNYSFVYVKQENAQKVLDSVNGKTYRGRKVKADFSKDSTNNAN